ncbi:MAG: shikimate dehydrogenase [Candidatus Halalkalibacterium sp. M3_1C_030]
MNLTEFRKSNLSDSPHFLLFGNPVSHSLSPLMHNTAAAYYGIETEYHAIRLEQTELTILAAHLNEDLFKGANITIPYKQLLMDYMDRLDDTASEIGAINTIVREQYSPVGYNTDSYGFAVPLEAYEDELYESRVIVFGTGGATRAIVHALKAMGVSEIVLISRNPAGITEYQEDDAIRVEGYDSWTAFTDETSLIVNATPIGMSPKTGEAPIREEEKEVLSGKICYDIVYNPVKTRFLAMAEEAGARTIGGLEMLMHQGSRSFELWTGKPFPIDEVRKKLHEAIQG